MFFFGRKKKPPRRLSRSMPAGEQQKRSAFRMPIEFDVFYTLEGRPGRRHGRANDLSAGGLRLSCDEDFFKGSVLALDFTLPDDFLASMTVEKEVYEQTPFGLRPETVRVRPPGFAPFHVRAKVLAPFFDVLDRTFAYGMAFVDIEEKTREELQRYVHLWQIHYIRTRRGELE
jgi:hypothetical protein